MNEVKDKLIDYLIEEANCDICAKCAYCQPLDESVDYEPCRAREQDGNVACRNGMIEYFKTNG